MLAFSSILIKNNMITIISEVSDSSTSLICLWLKKLNIDFKRYNSINDIDFTITNSKKVEVEIGVLWYRRALKTILGTFSGKSDSWSRGINNELLSVQNSFFNSFKSKHNIGSPYTSRINKIHQLEVAENVGLQVPKYIVTSNKKDLIDFIRLFEKTVTKPISDVFTVMYEEFYSIPYSKYCTEKDLEYLDSKIFPVFCQEYIPKEYELRIFVFEDCIYPMAIFSQANDKTKVDFRRYDYNKPNRRVRYTINKTLENRIKELMKNLRLQTGSIDILVFKGEYYFLEVNPVGQFGMVSYPCNYGIEKDIANKLIELDNG